jgi:DNA-binding FrmR family transcriptional regulator
MKIENAEYSKGASKDKDKVVSILATIDGKLSSVPLVEGNRHYDEIMKQVKAGTLTIKDAD